MVKILVGQINLLVGDFDGNTHKIETFSKAGLVDNDGASLVAVFPELALIGYPPEDLLLRPSLKKRVAACLERLKQFSKDYPSLYLVVGTPLVVEDRCYNAAVVINQGEIITSYYKQHLPNYRVFDEERYFIKGSESGVFDVEGVTIGLSICEDIWHAEPLQQAVSSGAELLISLNASPFHIDKVQQREQCLLMRCQESAIPIVYVNQVGSQDELVFDGGSMALNSSGEVVARADFFNEQSLIVSLNDLKKPNNDDSLLPQEIPTVTELIYRALVLGVRDYVNKNGFKGVVLGLSGGIDSALTLAIAVDALGSDRVEAIMMPFIYTSSMSQEDAEDEAKRLDVSYQSISIEPMYQAFVSSLSNEFSGLPADETEENIQARCRGVLLMAVSNKKGYLVLTTGNKSELAVGYCTLYGDMAGGFDVLKDVSKTMVFELSKYRNTLGQVIPKRVIDRPPSAELAPDQKDEDSLPPYEQLDQLLELYVEQDVSATELIERGFESSVVNRIVRLIDLNEYKRRQAPIGIRISRRAFGKDRRYPITNGWKMGD